MPRPRSLMAAGAASGPTPFIAYYRVSTVQQGVSGLGLEDQQAKVAERIRAENGRLIEAFTEVESGKVTDEDRPELAKALAAARAKRATLIVGKLDRLARNARFLLSLVEGSGDGGVVFSEIPALPPGAIGKFIITMLAAVAELEAGLISERTKAALAVVKQAIARDGFWVSRKTGRKITRLGGPNMTPGRNHVARKGRQAQTKRADRRAGDVIDFIRDAEQLLGDHASLRNIAAKLEFWGVRPPMEGGHWHATQVKRAIARAAAKGEAA